MYFWWWHSNRFKKVLHCGFDLHFPDCELHWASFQALVLLYIFFGKRKNKSLFFFCYWVVNVLFISWIFALYISWISHNRYVICKYFLPFLSLFILLMASFAALYFSFQYVWNIRINKYFGQWKFLIIKYYINKWTNKNISIL